MKTSKVLIYNISELRGILFNYYSDILKDTATEVINDGVSIIPDIIMDKGVLHLTPEELVIASAAWAEMKIDMQEPDADAIIMIDGDGKSHLLTPNITIDMEEKAKKTKKQK